MHKRLTIQCMDWVDGDIYEEKTVFYTTASGEQKKKDESRNKYVIRTYGRTAKGKSVCIQCHDFMPYFYLEVPPSWTSIDIAKFKRIFADDKIKTMFPNSDLNYYIAQSLISVELVERKKYFGFNNNKTFKFVKISFDSIRAFYAYRKLFESAIHEPKVLKQLGFSAPSHRFTLFESNITPLIRFLHERKINASGHITIKGGLYATEPELRTRCNINVMTGWTNISPISKDQNVPFIIAAYDIECYSSRKGSDGKKLFPSADIDADVITQIGTTFHRYGEKKCFFRHIVTLGQASAIDGATVECFETEREVIMAWAKVIDKMDPDMVCGHNIWGFDDAYIKARVDPDQSSRPSAIPFLSSFLAVYSRNKDKPAKFVSKVLESSAKGRNENKYFIGEGMVSFDTMKILRADPSKNLASYSLNNVAAEFLRYPITKIINSDAILGTTTFETSNIFYMNINQYIRINYFDGILDHNEYADKMYIIAIDQEKMQFTVKHIVDNSILQIGKNDDYRVYWCVAKDDMNPQDIFAKQDGSDDDRGLVAKYCIQDCEICNLLVISLSIISNNMGISNVCYVPFSYLFTRGQGILIYSLVLYFCAEDDYLIESIPYNPSLEKVEGAIVLVPKPDIYLEPIVVVDFASLYPSQIIAENLTSDAFVSAKYYDNTGALYQVDGEKNHINLDEFNYNVIDFEIKDINQVVIGRKVCTFAEAKNGEKGILAKMEVKLLQARKDTKERMTHKTITTSGLVTFSGKIISNKDGVVTIKLDSGNLELINNADITAIKNRYSDFEISILDGLQAAYKVICNSIYGQTVASSSKISDKNVGASITASSRKQLLTAKHLIETLFQGVKAIYGDTDSLFLSVKDHLAKVFGQDINISTMTKAEEEKYIQAAINFGRDVVAPTITGKLKTPTSLTYEKVFCIFILLRKKGYVAPKYENSASKSKITWMGCVLKRRDNPPFVKEIYYNIIKAIVKYKDVEKAKYMYHAYVADLLNGKIPTDKFVLSKSLAKEYANPSSMAHKMLADRMYERDAGTAPKVNERVQYVIVDEKHLKCFMDNCKTKLDAKKCKCIKCMRLFCKQHLNAHSKVCIVQCRFCHQLTDIITCKTCHGYYCADDYEKHNKKVCKKPVSQKLMQGDLLENPDYAKEHNIPLDYRYYLEHQLKEPIYQIFNLKMEDPNEIIEDLILKDNLKKNGSRDITSFFTQF